MPTKPTQLRIPPATLELIDTQAKSRGVTRTALILEAVEKHLAPITQKDPERLETAIRSDVGPLYKCPTYGCPTRSNAPKKTCSIHGRTVVAI